MNPDSDHKFYYVYVLRSKKTNQWYTGYTEDLRKRLKEHNDGKSKYTKKRGPYELIYYESYKNKDDARSRELQIKSGTGKAYLRKRLNRFLSLSG
jgi:putative endonuclease